MHVLTTTSLTVKNITALGEPLPLCIAGSELIQEQHATASPATQYVCCCHDKLLSAVPRALLPQAAHSCGKQKVQQASHWRVWIPQTPLGHLIQQHL